MAPQDPIKPHTPYRGRIAPSPTGFLHLGHARTFWIAYQRCLEAQGTLIYRDEDIDQARCKAHFAQAAQEDLRQLGIHWHEGPDLDGPHTPYQQSLAIPTFAQHLKPLALQGYIYPCPHSRKTIAQHPDARTGAQGEAIFPPALRSPGIAANDPIPLDINWRFRVPAQQSISFHDANCGPCSYQTDTDFGDFLVWRKDGMPAYELAVVVDDHRMHITEVVRGQDLLLSTARQLLLYQAFGWKPPTFYHAPLVTDDQGRRLAKRTDALALRTLFRQGTTPGQIRASFT